MAADRRRNRGPYTAVDKSYLIHVSHAGVLEIAVDRDRSMGVERKVQFGEGDISGVKEAPVLPASERSVTLLSILSF